MFFCCFLFLFCFCCVFFHCHFFFRFFFVFFSTTASLALRRTPPSCPHPPAFPCKAVFHKPSDSVFSLLPLPCWIQCSDSPWRLLPPSFSFFPFSPLPACGSICKLNLRDRLILLAAAVGWFGLVLTPSLPQSYLKKMAIKVWNWKPFILFLLFLYHSMWKGFYQNGEHQKNMYHRNRKYTVCRPVCALFSPKIVQAGVVKRLNISLAPHTVYQLYGHSCDFAHHNSWNTKMALISAHLNAGVIVVVSVCGVSYSSPSPPPGTLVPASTSLRTTWQQTSLMNGQCLRQQE